MKNFQIYLSAAFMLLGAALSSCHEKLSVTAEVEQPPVITQFSPASGAAGTEVTIEGENLGEVDTVTIGGGVAEIKYRISNNKMVVKVTAASKTGKIAVKTYMVGESESEDEFAVDYVTPQFSTLPDMASMGQEIVLEGTGLNAVSSISFGADPQTAIASEIEYQSDTELVTTVPTNIPASVSEMNIYFSYFTDGVEMQQACPQTVTVDRPIPEVTDIPAEADENTSITITGTHLNLVTEVWFGDEKASMVEQDETHIVVSVPDIDESESEGRVVAVKMKYYDTEEVIRQDFIIKWVRTWKFYHWENITLGAQGVAESIGSFFNAETGHIYTSPELVGAIEDNYGVYFGMYNSNDNFTFCSPDNYAGKIKNFKYTNDEGKAEAIGTNITFPNTVKFRVLKSGESTTYDKYIAWINDENLDALDSLDVNTFATEINPNARGPEFAKGDVIAFGLFDDTIVQKWGFIKVIDVHPDGNNSTVTFDCYFQK